MTTTGRRPRSADAATMATPSATNGRHRTALAHAGERLRPRQKAEEDQRDSTRGRPDCDRRALTASAITGWRRSLPRRLPFVASRCVWTILIFYKLLI
jgi:hypothetical protein